MSTNDAATLRLLTFDNATSQPGTPHECTGYSCEHPDCVAERARLVARGVRKRRPLPTRRAAA